jgi:hypothetical protein
MISILVQRKTEEIEFDEFICEIDINTMFRDNVSNQPDPGSD